jgi:hypothetical protein
MPLAAEEGDVDRCGREIPSTTLGGRCRIPSTSATQQNETGSS